MIPDRPPKLLLWVYVVGTIALALLCLAGAAGDFYAARPEWWKLALFALLAGLLELMVVPLAEGGGVAASFAAYFAGLLVLGPSIIVCVAAPITLLTELLPARRKPLRAAFNASHTVLSLTGAGWVYETLGGMVGQVVVPRDLPALFGTALSLWAMETGWVALAASLERRRKVGRWLRASLVPMLTLDAALASVGLLLALLYQSRSDLVAQQGWQGPALLILIALIPSGLLFYAYRLQGHVRQVYEESLRTLASLLERKVEGRDAGHGVKVAALAAAMAQAMELPPQEVEQIRYAGFLHDIGKVAVPSSMLARGRAQGGTEAYPLRLHPEIGEQILKPIHFLRPAARMVRAHHERWDGLGYPDGLRGEEIPLGARILSIANAYVGMTSVLPPEKALGRIRQAAGARFDPYLAEVLAILLHESGELAASEQPNWQVALGRMPHWML